MDTLDELVTSLQNQPNLVRRLEKENLTVELSSSGGYIAWITKDRNEWTVGFDGWHDHFDSEAEAVSCFSQLMSGECHLEVSYRGNTAYRWAIQRKIDDGWRTVSTTGYYLYAFWRPKRTEYRPITGIELA